MSQAACVALKMRQPYSPSIRTVIRPVIPPAIRLLGLTEMLEFLELLGANGLSLIRPVGDGLVRGAYFCLVPIKSFFVTLDKWVRRRIRSCYWKQWRKPSARIRNLMKLGLDRNDAVPFGSCSRGPWFMSRCESVQSTLSNSHLQQTGLVNLFEIWSKLAPKRGNA